MCIGSNRQHTIEIHKKSDDNTTQVTKKTKQNKKKQINMTRERLSEFSEQTKYVSGDDENQTFLLNAKPLCVPFSFNMKHLSAKWSKIG